MFTSGINWPNHNSLSIVLQCCGSGLPQVLAVSELLPLGYLASGWAFTLVVVFSKLILTCNCAAGCIECPILENKGQTSAPHLFKCSFSEDVKTLSIIATACIELSNWYNSLALPPANTCGDRMALVHQKTM